MIITTSIFNRKEWKWMIFCFLLNYLLEKVSAFMSNREFKKLKSLNFSRITFFFDSLIPVKLY